MVLILFDRQRQYATPHVDPMPQQLPHESRSDATRKCNRYGFMFQDEVDDAISKPVAAFTRHLALLTGWRCHAPLHLRDRDLASLRSGGNEIRRRINAMA